VSGQTSPSAGKVALTCPHCGFKQLESPYTKSTFCRKCGEYYEPGKAKPVLRNERPSLVARVSQFLARKKTREITCFDCGAVQTVSSSSTSSICPQCSAYIDLSDFKINTAFSRMIQTQGMVTIGAKADVTSSKVACREALVQGKLRGNLFCTNTATVKYKGKISGSVEARNIVVAKRSEVEFVRVVKAKAIEVAGTVSANLHIDGIVKITKHGRLEGTVHAKGIVVEKGGIFLGELVIGQSAFVQQELVAVAHPAAKNGEKPASKPEKKPPSDGQEDLPLGL